MVVAVMPNRSDCIFSAWIAVSGQPLLAQLSQLSAFETGRPLVFNKGTPKVSTTFSMGEERRVRSDSGP